jgi:DNA-directed RNA polymerase specialized sigma24 family protein
MMTRDDPMLRMVTTLLDPIQPMPTQVFHEGTAALRNYLRRRFAAQLGRNDIDDLASDAVTQLLDASHRGLVGNDGNPTGYLLKIATNSAFSMIKKGQGTIPLNVLSSSPFLTDEEAATRFDRLATSEFVRQALTHARRAGDMTAVRVMTYMLDQIQRTGRVPSGRRTGEALGLSHVGVGKAMRRLRGYLSAAAGA